MNNSKIEWTDHTFNPWIGCTKVSPGCKNCYAEARDRRHLIEKVDHWGKGAPRLRTSASYWKQPLKWNAILQGLHVAPLMICDCCGNLYAGRESCLHTTHLHRPRVFCASLADIFDDEVPIEWLADFLALVHATSNLDWLLLTKRPENWIGRIADAMNYWADEGNEELTLWLHEWITGTPLQNVWVGTSVEDQKRADERIPLLLQIPAAVRFLSCEPLLGPVDLDPHWLGSGGRTGDNYQQPQIHWAIVGGESGPKARPMHSDWPRSLRDQCVAAGVSFFFKQWGEWIPTQQAPEYICGIDISGSVTAPELGSHWRVGKKKAGRLLDGREWSQFPNLSGIRSPQSEIA